MNVKMGNSECNSNSSVIVKDGEREWLRIDGEVRQGFFHVPLAV